MRLFWVCLSGESSLLEEDEDWWWMLKRLGKLRKCCVFDKEVDAG